MLWDGLAEPKQYDYFTNEYQVGIQNPGKGLLLEKFKSFKLAHDFIVEMLAPDGEYRIVNYSVKHYYFEDMKTAHQLRTWEELRLLEPEFNAPPPSSGV